MAGGVEMNFYFKKWSKIYLFYGVIFFLLGLFGYLASNEDSLVYWSSKQLAKLNNVLTILKKPWWDNNEEVPVLANKVSKVLLFYNSNSNSNEAVNYFVNQIQKKWNTNYQKVTILPVTDLRDLDENLSELIYQRTTWVFVGFNKNKIPVPIGDTSCFQFKLLFSIPEQALDLSLLKLMKEMSEKLPSFTISKRLLEHCIVFEFGWNENIESQNLSYDILNTLAEILNEYYLRNNQAENLN